MSLNVISRNEIHSALILLISEAMSILVTEVIYQA